LIDETLRARGEEDIVHGGHHYTETANVLDPHVGGGSGTTSGTTGSSGLGSGTTGSGTSGTGHHHHGHHHNSGATGGTTGTSDYTGSTGTSGTTGGLGSSGTTGGLGSNTDSSTNYQTSSSTGGIGGSTGATSEGLGSGRGFEDNRSGYDSSSRTGTSGGYDASSGTGLSQGGADGTGLGGAVSQREFEKTTGAASHERGNTGEYDTLASGTPSGVNLDRAQESTGTGNIGGSSDTGYGSNTGGSNTGYDDSSRTGGLGSGSTGLGSGTSGDTYGSSGNTSNTRGTGL